MKDFFINKHNTNFSTYITDISPNLNTTNGALTIVDNNYPNIIDGLVPNTNNIFLDNIFIAGGYGFASIEDYNKASYLITTYNDSYIYLLNEINKINNLRFNLEYTYETSENILDKKYNKYGFITSYKYLDVYNNDNNTYTISLKEKDTKYIDNIDFKIIKSEDEQNNITFSDTNFIEIGQTTTLCYLFTRFNNNGNIDDLNQSTGDIYINDYKIDLLNDFYNIENELNVYNNDLIYKSSLRFDKYHNEDINLVCKRNDEIVYSYTYKNFLKWRYTALPFNTKKLSILINTLSENSQNMLRSIYVFDRYNFNDINFDENSVEINNAIADIFEFVENNYDNMSIFLDDETNIEFLGDGYIYNDDSVYMHDYIVVRLETSNYPEFDFYLNNILNNGWNSLLINYGNVQYKIFQSPQKYIGKHTWTIKYRYD